MDEIAFLWIIYHADPIDILRERIATSIISMFLSWHAPLCRDHLFATGQAIEDHKIRSNLLFKVSLAVKLIN